MSRTCFALWGAALAACAGCGGGSSATTDAGDAPTSAGDAPPMDVPFGGVTLDVDGDISPVHDPVIIAASGKYYIYSTGEGLPIHESSDLVHWRLTGSAFLQKPDWVKTTAESDPNGLWAPDLSFFNGQYHLYYAASSFGSRNSCIGHATSPSLDPLAWADHGSVICSTTDDDWNAIDPAAVVDQAGGAWLAFGSFWSGLKVMPLDSDGNVVGTAMTSLATRSNQAVEASYIIHHGDSYYLFESVDFCCRGVDSTYKIMVGRSASITGPYVDRDGTPLLAGGGTLILQGDTRWKGPGHNAILHTDAGDYNIYHSYDADAGGAPTLRISEMTWTSDGWPVSAGP